MKKLFSILAFLFIVLAISAEDGHALWLRMEKNAKPARVKVIGVKNNDIVNTAVGELKNYWKGGDVTLSLLAPMRGAGIKYVTDAYTIKDRKGRVTISSTSPSGLLYGAYTLLRRSFVGERLEVAEKPSSELRILNHWDNPNGTCERGYAGHSIFWKENGEADLQRVKEYGRACASIGINATVLNNVNAKKRMLDSAKLKEVKRIADALRPYGIHVFMSVNFASSKTLGNMETADPLDKNVIVWWENKAKEIYQLIPDFGGFLVKANSEGEPGPMDYGRTHAAGANMLADALTKGYNAVNRKSLVQNTFDHPRVMWRAFVYSPTGTDRASQAYDEFMSLDGKFRENVILQIKNGPIDFQPREAVSPLFFSLKSTEMMPELQITQEYTGESIQTCFLASMWREFYDTINKYENSQSNTRFKAVAGVANIGDTCNWCGSDMAQANWYAFGRMAWNDKLTPDVIAAEWLKQTYTKDENFVKPMVKLLCGSRETMVRYMMPLGLHHIFAGGHHYGPEPWCDPDGWREDWKPKYYHKADSIGLGFDRTVEGSNNVHQYPKVLRDIYNNVEKCPEELLLWFHHVPWTHTMHNGETLWSALCHTYDQGVKEAESFDSLWIQMKPYVDSERYEGQKINFDRQVKDAWWWRDACLLYFQTFSKMPLPADCQAPRHKLDEMERFHLDLDNYSRAPIDKLPE